MKKITEVNSRNRKFLILKDENGYWGLEDTLFNNGILIKKVNGLQGNLSKTLDECIKAVLFRIECEFLTNNGLDIMVALQEATKTVYGV